MKTFAIIFVVCLVGAVSALDDGQKPKRDERKEACVAESGVDPAKLHDAREGLIDGTDGKLSCFIACMMRKIGVMNDKGAFDEATVRSMISSEAIAADKINEVINKCKTVTGVDDCDTGRKIYNCCNENELFPMFG